MMYNSGMANAFHTPEQVAAYLQFSVKTIYRYLRAGKLHGIKTSQKAWRIPRSEIERFTKSGI